jgi:hypothetical protein
LRAFSNSHACSITDKPMQLTYSSYVSLGPLALIFTALFNLR